MPLPPKGDPSRPLHLAVRTTRVIGVLGVMFGVLALAGTMHLYGQSAGRTILLALIVQLGVGGAYLTLGTAMLIFAMAMKKHRLWAIYGALCIAGLGLAAIVMAMIGTALGATRHVGTYYYFATILLQLLFAAAFGELIYLLIKARAFVISQEGMIHGFQPLMPGSAADRR